MNANDFIERASLFERRIESVKRLVSKVRPLARCRRCCARRRERAAGRSD